MISAEFEVDGPMIDAAETRCRCCERTYHKERSAMNARWHCSDELLFVRPTPILICFLFRLDPLHVPLFSMDTLHRFFPQIGHLLVHLLTSNHYFSFFSLLVTTRISASHWHERMRGCASADARDWQELECKVLEGDELKTSVSIACLC